MANNFGVVETLHDDSPQNRKYLETALAALQTAVATLDSDDFKAHKGWKLDKEDKKTGDKVWSKQYEFCKGFLSEAEFPTDPESFLRDAFYNVEKMVDWNPSVLECKILLKLGDQSDVYYNASKDVLMVSSRDMVQARVWRKVGDTFTWSEVSVEYDGKPEVKGRVRAHNYPSFFRLSPVAGKPGHCFAQWFMNPDLKGMLPKAVTNAFMYKQMLDHIGHMRKHVTDVK